MKLVITRKLARKTQPGRRAEGAVDMATELGAIDVACARIAAIDREDARC